MLVTVKILIRDFVGPSQVWSGSADGVFVWTDESSTGKINVDEGRCIVLPNDKGKLEQSTAVLTEVVFTFPSIVHLAVVFLEPSLMAKPNMFVQYLHSASTLPRHL